VGFSGALDQIVEHSLPLRDPDACHGSLHLSALEALASYVAPSAGDSGALVLSSAWSRQKVDVALAAWATLRHDETPFAHRAASAASFSANATNHVAVEPHPEAIARLLSFARQIARGLGARGLLKDGSPAQMLATHVSALLSAALRASVAEVNGDPPPKEPLLEDLARAFATIETAANGPIAAPIVADVHANSRSGQVLEVGTRPIEELWIVLRDPRTFAPTLFVGAHVGHAELATSPRMTDRAWRARAAPAPDWTRATSTSASP